jgi:elongation factor 1-alpha
MHLTLPLTLFDGPRCVELFSEFPALGRVLVRDGTKIVAIGVVKQIVREEGAGKTSTKK